MASTAEEDAKLLLMEAANLYRSVPFAGGSQFSMADALRMVGIEGKLAKTDAYKERLKRMLKGIKAEPFSDDNLSSKEQVQEGKIRQCMFIVETTKKDRDGISKLSVSDAMRLAGCTNKEARKNTGLHAKIDRWLKKRKKQREIEESAQIAQKENEVKAYAALDSTVEPARSGADLIEPLVDTRGIQYTGSGNVGVMCLNGGMDTVLDGGMDTVVVAHAYQGTQSETFCVDSPLSDVSSYVASSYQSAGSSPLALPKKAKPPLISSLTTSKDHRTTSKEAHAACKDVIELEDMFKSAYKVGTTLYASVKSGENTVEDLSSAEKCAIAINNLYGVELLSGYQLREAIKDGCVGLSPPRRGPSTRIPMDEIKLLANLVFTCESLEQSNCVENCMERAQVMSCLGEIVNECLKNRGEQPLKEVSFYRQIQQMNSRRQSVEVVDREKQGACFGSPSYHS